MLAVKYFIVKGHCLYLEENKRTLRKRKKRYKEKDRAERERERKESGTKATIEKNDYRLKNERLLCILNSFMVLFRSMHMLFYLDPNLIDAIMTSKYM